MKGGKMTALISGGIGKCLVFSSFIPKLYKKYGEFNIMSPWQDLFEGVEGVRRSISISVEYGYEDYFKGQDRVAPEPYNNNDFYRKKIGLREAYAREMGLEYNDEEDLPFSPTSFNPAVKEKIDELTKDGGKYIVVQFMGGNQAMNGKQNQKTMTKDYPPKLIEEFVMKFLKKYEKRNYRIVNYGLPFEFAIPNTLPTDDIPYTAAGYLLSKAETFVAVDSNLQHFSACREVKKKGVVLWGATDPVSFGYKHNVNLSGECPYKDLHCNRPYFMPTSDVVGKGNPWMCKTKDCVEISPDAILKELEPILK